MQFVVDKAETPRQYHNVDRLTLISRENSNHSITIDFPILEINLKKGNIVEVHCGKNDEQHKDRDRLVLHASLVKPGTYSAGGLMITLSGFSINLLTSCGVAKTKDDGMNGDGMNGGVCVMNETNETNDDETVDFVVVI